MATSTKDHIKNIFKRQKAFFATQQTKDVGSVKIIATLLCCLCSFTDAICEDVNIDLNKKQAGSIIC